MTLRILDFEPGHAAAFRDLNLEWIERYFVIEPSDRKALDDPKVSIIDPGGAILMAALGDDLVGACALIRLDDKRFELAKMAVAPRAQGAGVGLHLGQAVLAKARDLGARSVYLESSTRLAPALALYRKLGFVKVDGPPSPYDRCDIQMEVILGP